MRQPRGARALAGPAGPALAEPALPVGGPEGRGTDSDTGSSNATGDPWFDDEPNDQDDDRLPAPPVPPLLSAQWQLGIWGQLPALEDVWDLASMDGHPAGDAGWLIHDHSYRLWVRLAVPIPAPFAAAVLPSRVI